MSPSATTPISTLVPVTNEAFELFFALLALRNHAPALLDAAIVTAVFGFVGTLMLARYIEQSNRQDWESNEE